MGKFIPPVNQLNNLTPRRSRAAFSARQNQSVLRQSKRLIRDSYSPDAFEQVGTLKAVVLEVVSKFENTPITSWKYSKTIAMAVEDKAVPFAEIRFRVPELHAHLPEPVDPNDQAAINKHPIALLFQTTDGSIPEVGDIVDVDFADKNNFRDAFITSVVTKGSQNSTPATEVACSISDTFNSATPSLNSTQPSGDAQTSSSSKISGDPSSESTEDGVDFDYSVMDNQLVSNYFASIEDFNTMTEFRNYSQTLQIMKSKNVYNVTIQVAKDRDLLTDFQRLKKVSEILSKNNVGLYLWISTSHINSNDAVEHMLNIIKRIETRGVFFEPTGNWTEEQSEYFNVSVFSVVKDLGLTFGALMTDPNSTFNFTEDLDIAYILRNNVDNYETEFFEPPLINSAEPFGYGLYHLNGYNFLPTTDDPCEDGTRSPERLNNEMNTSLSKEKFGFLDYSLLTQDFVQVIQDKIADPNLQNLLSTTVETKQIPKANLEVSSETIQQKEPPTFNSESSGSQDVKEAPAPANAFTPGLQCSPSAMGAVSYATATGNPPSPSFRFDSIVGRENLLWTTNSGRILTQAHVDFLNKLAQKVYQKIPLTDPIFTGTDAKKLRITDAVRTPEKQVELMWDKRKKKTAAQVKKLYSNAWWAKKVVDLYPYASGNTLETDKDRFKSSFSHPNYAQAVAVVKSRVAQGSEKGGHLYGNGVDIGTIFHIHIEGLKSSAGQRVSVETMMKSRFVQVVTQACRELGAGFVVEDYQEHIHITFPT